MPSLKGTNRSRSPPERTHGGEIETGEKGSPYSGKKTAEQKVAGSKGTETFRRPKFLKS